MSALASNGVNGDVVDDDALIAAKMNGFTAHVNGEMTNGVDVDDIENTGSDPELEAEIQYAKEHGGGDIATIKQKLRKARSGEAEPIVQSLNGVVQVPRAQKNQRKSRAGHGRGLPKKGGAGGKGVWGAPGRVYEEPEMDADDPNYDSDAQANVTFETIQPDLSEDVLAKAFETEILEFYGTGKVNDAVESFGEMGLTSKARTLLVRLMVSLAIDHKQTQRELTSQLLAELTAKRVLSPLDVERAFDNLLTVDLPELIVDCPTAAQILGNFMARAVADEAAPQGLVDGDKAKTAVTPQATEAIERAQALCSSKNKHRLNDVWGVSVNGRRPVRYLSKKIKLIIDEYLTSGEVCEAMRCLRELEVPHFHHELVFQAGTTVIESMHARPQRLLTDLLTTLFKADVLTSDAIRVGVQRLFHALPDLSLDVPPAYTLMESWLDALRRAGLVSDELARKMPQRGRKRFVSEGDGGRFKVIDVSHPLI